MTTLTPTPLRTPVERWESRAEIPLLLLAVAFLVAYAWPVIDPNLDADLEGVLEAGSWTIWGAFAIDFAVRLVLATDRPRYALRHWYDVVLITVPMLRPLRLLRLLAFARILNRSVLGSLAGRVGVYVAGAAAAAVGIGALAVLDAEQEAADANILSFGDAIWWASTTVTTVGYGDRYPVTASGRLIAVGLMLVGIAVVSSLTAIIAAWLVENVQKAQAPAHHGGEE